jgi:hypothetical protein
LNQDIKNSELLYPARPDVQYLTGRDKMEIFYHKLTQCDEVLTDVEQESWKGREGKQVRTTVFLWRVGGY